MDRATPNFHPENDCETVNPETIGCIIGGIKTLAQATKKHCFPSVPFWLLCKLFQHLVMLLGVS